jgi:hypothetical protein
MFSHDDHAICVVMADEGWHRVDIASNSCKITKTRPEIAEK